MCEKLLARMTQSDLLREAAHMVDDDRFDTTTSCASVNPATGDVLGSVPNLGATEAERASHRC